MSKTKGFTEEWYEKRRLNKELPVGAPPVSRRPKLDGEAVVREYESMQAYRASLKTIPDRAENGVTYTNIVLSGLTAGMNGDKGLMRQHWAKRGKIRDLYISRLNALDIMKFQGTVKVTYTRYCSRLMDWDNACASFKILGDCLVHARILQDDSPKIIKEFIPKQIQCKVNEESVEILIEKYI